MHQFTYSASPGQLSGKYTDNSITNYNTVYTTSSRLTTVGLCRC